MGEGVRVKQLHRDEVGGEVGGFFVLMLGVRGGGRRRGRRWEGVERGRGAVCLIDLRLTVES